jgi:transcriptional regulator with XRE-family HTH domain
MTDIQHHGELLKKLIRVKKMTVDDFAKKIGKHRQTVHYWYKIDTFKREVIKIVSAALSISPSVFYSAQGASVSPDKENNVSSLLHNGERLREITETKGVKDVALAQALGISRQRLYDLYKSAALDDKYVILASRFLGVPTFDITGDKKRFFQENDIYILLQQIVQREEKVLSRLDEIEKRMDKGKK